jgi:ribosomal protein S18 acetylase RimI-like enzyme
MDIRLLHPSDIPHVQHANITNLPENYFLKYYLYHALSWPQLSFVAVDVSRPKKTPYDYPRIVGYVLAKMEEDVSSVALLYTSLYPYLYLSASAICSGVNESLHRSSLRTGSSTGTSRVSASCGHTAGSASPRNS